MHRFLLLVLLTCLVLEMVSAQDNKDHAFERLNKIVTPSFGPL
jgi:hypothetical protein